MTVETRKPRAYVWAKLSDELIFPGILNYMRHPDRRWVETWMTGVLNGWTAESVGRLYVSDKLAEQTLWVARIHRDLNENGSTAVELMFDMFNEYVSEGLALEDAEKLEKIQHILLVLQRVFPPEGQKMSLFEMFMQESLYWATHTDTNAYSAMGNCVEAKPIFDFVEGDGIDVPYVDINMQARHRVNQFFNLNGVSPATERQLRRYQILLMLDE